MCAGRRRTGCCCSCVCWNVLLSTGSLMSITVAWEPVLGKTVYECGCELLSCLGSRDCVAEVH